VEKEGLFFSKNVQFSSENDGQNYD